MKLIRAQASDSNRINEYFKTTLYPTPIDLRIERQEDFFLQYKVQSDDYVTYLLVNNDNEIKAMCSLIFREAIIENKTHTIAFATDLRVSQERKAILGWMSQFIPALEEERDKRNCQYVFSTVSKFQQQAQNAFIRPRSARKHTLRYYLFRKFNLVNLHGLYPFHPKPLKSVQIRPAHESDIPKLQEYIRNKQLMRPLYFPEKSEDLGHLIKHWPNLKISDFLLAQDTRDNIVGCIALWNSADVQKFFPQNLNKKAETFAQTIGFLSMMGISRRLMHKNRPLQIGQLLHLYVDNHDILYSILLAAWKRSKGCNFLMYPHFDSEFMTSPPKSFISTHINFGLYCILAPTDPVPDFLKPSYFGDPPDFEVAFI